MSGLNKFRKESCVQVQLTQDISVYWTECRLSPLSLYSWIRWFAVHWSGMSAQCTVLEQVKGCASVSCLINTEPLELLQFFLINPKMDMWGPRGPRTTSNVCSTLHSQKDWLISLFIIISDNILFIFTSTAQWANSFWECNDKMLRHSPIICFYLTLTVQLSTEEFGENLWNLRLFMPWHDALRPMPSNAR